MYLPPYPSSLSYYRPILLLSLFPLCLRISRFQIEFQSVFRSRVAASATTPRGEVIFYSGATPPLLYRCVPPL